MSVTGLSTKKSTIGTVSDTVTTQPMGNAAIPYKPTIPAAVFRSSRDVGSAPEYTVNSNTELTLYEVPEPAFTASSLAAVFWTDIEGNSHFVIDCPITSVNDFHVILTTPATIPAGQSNFSSIVAGVTQVTVAVATLATNDLPSNPDITGLNLADSHLLQLLLSCKGGVGAFELFATPYGVLSGSTGNWNATAHTLTVSGAGWEVNGLTGLAFTIGGNSYTCASNTATVATMTAAGSTSTNSSLSWSIAAPFSALVWNYAFAGDYYEYLAGESNQPFNGTITSMRCYNATMKPLTMSLGALVI